LPIRIGNAAAEQLQLDIYGEALDSIYFADAHGLEIGHVGWTALVTLLDWLTDNWDQPDDGIWESRGGRQDFTYGRLMCWVAFDRAIRLATSRARPASLERWTAARDGIYEQIMARGWNAEKQAFVQHYASDVLDSALLRMGTVGFLSPYDPMWQSTLRAMDEELVTDGLVYRYDPSASPDGLQGSEGTFSLCSFTYVDALARAGRVDEAPNPSPPPPHPPARPGAGPPPPPRGPTRLREDPDLRQPRRPVRRGDRPDRRADRQLPPGLHPPLAHRRRPDAGPRARPARGARPAPLGTHAGATPAGTAGEPGGRRGARSGAGRVRLRHGPDRQRAAGRRPGVTAGEPARLRARSSTAVRARTSSSDGVDHMGGPG
jgi:hypothetical protein